jgi:hypothetical protein
MSGIPDLGIFSAQVGSSRLACDPLHGWRAPHASRRTHHERSNRTRMHVTALGCPQHEADDTRAAEAHFGTLRAISSSSWKPHLNLPLIHAILNGWSSN